MPPIGQEVRRPDLTSRGDVAWARGAEGVEVVEGAGSIRLHRGQSRCKPISQLDSRESAGM